MWAPPNMEMVARRVCGVRERSDAGGLLVKQTTKERMSARNSERVPGLVQAGLRIVTLARRCSDALLRCRGLAAWRKPDKRKNLGKKCTHRPRSALAGVEAKSTFGPRRPGRNRGTCTLEQDDMHAASDHEVVRPLASSLFARLGHGRRSARQQLVSARFDSSAGEGCATVRLTTPMRSPIMPDSP